MELAVGSHAERILEPSAASGGDLDGTTDAPGVNGRYLRRQDWEPGEDVIIAGSVSDDDAKKVYPQGWRAPRPYLRFVPQPGL
jgi:hypothetical protein